MPQLDGNAILELLIRTGEERVVEKPDVLPRAAERVYGALEALRAAQALDEQDVKRWVAVIQERLPYEWPPEECTFAFRGAGEHLGSLVKAISTRGEEAAGLREPRVLIFGEGLAVEWTYEPERPWSKGSPAPFGEPPEEWPLGHTASPPPPAFTVSDDLGTPYNVYGWSVDGSHARWGGESRFLPAPPQAARKVVVRFRDLLAEAEL